MTELAEDIRIAKEHVPFMFMRLHAEHYWLTKVLLQMDEIDLVRHEAPEGGARERLGSTRVHTRTRAC